MKKALFLLFLGLLPIFVLAGTDIYAGNVSGYWMLRDSPFIIHGDIAVPVNDSLIIDQGVEIKFAGHYEIYVSGYIKANGTHSNKITFTVSDTTGFSDYSTANGSWNGIYLDSGANASKFYYTIFEYSKKFATTRMGMPGNGAVIYAHSAKLIIKNCAFNNNYAQDNGGAIYLLNLSGAGVSSEISKSYFSYNYAEYDGAAIYIDNYDINIFNNEFAYNHAETKAGAISATNTSSMNISNNLFHNNYAETGGALYFYNTTCDFYNNTIAHNTTDESGGGITFGDAVSLDFANNIIYFNSSQQLYFITTPTLDARFSDIQDASSEYWYGFGCIDLDPMFINPPTNYAVSELSACVNAGDTLSNTYNIPSHDLNGSPRFNDGIIDMGAYEIATGAFYDFYANFHADIRNGYKPLGVQFYDDCEDANSWNWNFGDGYTSTEKNPFHTYTQSGVYSVSLAASGPLGSNSTTREMYITVENGTYINDSDVSGIWRTSESPYIIGTNIEVQLGNQLTIQPGVQVLFENNYSMTIYGTLLAQGTLSDSIYFSVTDTTGYSSNTHTGWAGIRFIDLASSSPARSYLSHCVLEYGKNSDDGGALYFYNTADYIDISYSKIKYCSANKGGAIALENSSMPSFAGVFLLNNKATLRGGAIYANNLSDFTFENGKISHNSAVTGSAIYADQNSQFYLNNILISKNDAQQGATIYLSDIGDINFRNLTIADNHRLVSGSTIASFNTGLTLKNSIIWNPNLNSEINTDDANNILLRFSNIRGGWATGESVYSVYPNFKNHITYKLSLVNQEQTAKNPLIDAGDPSCDFSQEPMPNGGRINLGVWGGTSKAEYSCQIVQTDINDNEDWYSNEMYVVTRDVTIEPTATLSIEAGSVIQTMGGYQIHIRGRIVADATRGDTIRFTNNYNDSGNETPWDGIVLEGSEIPLNSILANIVVENAVNGLQVIDKPIQLSDSKIEYNLDSRDNPVVGVLISGATSTALSNCDIIGYPTGISFQNSSRDDATPTLTNARVRNSSSSSRDTDVGVTIGGNVNATIDNCTIEDYTTGISQSAGAGINATPTITNTRIRNSSSSSRVLQNAIYLEDINNPMIDGNIIDGYSTGIKIVTTRRDQSTPTIQNTRLRNSPSNSRVNSSCGIYLGENVVADIINNEIEEFDTAIKYLGNGISTRDTPTITNTRIRNSTSSSRDSLFATGIELTNIINIVVDADSIGDYPIAIDIINTSRATSTPTITNTRIRNSSSSSRDRTYGIKIQGSVATFVSNVDIDNCDYGIHFIGTGTSLRDTPTLTNTRIRNSTSSSRGGGIAGIYYKDVISSLIDSCEISEYSKAIEMVNNYRTTSTPTLTNTRVRTSPSSSRSINTGIVLNGDFSGEISDNEIVNQDSAIVLYGGQANPLIKQNSIYFDAMESDDEGAVAIFTQNSSDLHIKSNTVYLYDYLLSVESDSANVYLSNIISYKNNPQYNPIFGNSYINITYSDIAKPDGAPYSGIGNINDDPLFYDVGKGDFSLRTGSPCIDTGDPEVLDSDGSRSDIGRYFRPSLKDFDSQFMFGALPSHNVQFTQKSTGFNSANTHWYWDVDNNGIYDIEGENPVYQYTESGVYSVKLKVIKNSIQDSLVKENFVVIQNTQLPAPQNVHLSVSNNNIDLTWDPIAWTRKDRGEYYLIYKSDRPDGDFEYLDRTNNIPSYTHVNGALSDRAFYKIIAFSGDFRSLILYIQMHKTISPLKEGTALIK